MRHSMRRLHHREGAALLALVALIGYFLYHLMGLHQPVVLSAAAGVGSGVVTFLMAWAVLRYSSYFDH